MGKMIVMRGVSGSGKSTRAKELVQEFMDTNPEEQAIVCSADAFFVNRDSGDYEFDSKKLPSAHSYCRTRAETAMELGVELVVIDNTNTRKWEYEGYVKLAEQFGYEAEVEMVGQLDESNLKVYANRNKHGVDLEVVRAQAKRFET
jgi:predicted kinase